MKTLNQVDQIFCRKSICFTFEQYLFTAAVSSPYWRNMNEKKRAITNCVNFGKMTWPKQIGLANERKEATERAEQWKKNKRTSAEKRTKEMSI